MSILDADLEGRCNTASVAVKTEQAMDTLVKSLHTVMGSDGKGVLGELKSNLTTLSGPQMKTVASSMARAALETTRGNVR